MMAALTSKEDSDRLIRDLMKKSKDLEKQITSMRKAHEDGAAALQEALLERAAMAEQFGQMKEERDGVEAKYQNLKAKNAKLKDKVSTLKGTIQEFETVLKDERGQYQQLEEKLEEEQSLAKRRERQLSNDLMLVTQERDGYAEQLVSLRDKISILSRELAEGERGGREKGARIVALETELLETRRAAEKAASANTERISNLECKLQSTADELAALQKLHRQEIARLTQERDGYKDQVETLRDKVSLLSRELADNQDCSASQGGRISDLEAELKTVKEQFSAQGQELAAALAERERKGQELDDFRRQLEELESEYKQAERAWNNDKALLTQDRDGYQAQVESLRDKVSTLSRELADGSDSNEQHAARVAELTATVESLEQEQARQQREHDSRVAELQAHLDAATKELDIRTDELRAAEEEHKRKSSGWKAERAQLASDRDGYKSQVDTLRDKVSAMAREAADAGDSSTAQLHQLQEQQRDSEQRLQQSLDTVTALQAQLQASHACASDREEERDQVMAEYTAARSQFEKDLTARTEEYNACKRELSALALDLENAQAAANAEAAALDSTLSMLRQQIQGHLDTQRQLEAELAAVKEQLHSVTADLDELQKSSTQDRKAWKAERAMLVSERDGATSQVETLRNKVSTLSRDLATAREGEEGAAAVDAALHRELEQLQDELYQVQQDLGKQKRAAEQLRVELSDAKGAAGEANAAAEKALRAKTAEFENLTEEATGLLDSVVEVLRQPAAQWAVGEGAVGALRGIQEVAVAAQRAWDRERAAIGSDAQGRNALDNEVTRLREKLEGSQLEVERLERELAAATAGTGVGVETLERSMAAERKQWKVERAQLRNERDGYSGQVSMLRDKVVELSRELADVRPHGTSVAGVLPAGQAGEHAGMESEGLLSKAGDDAVPNWSSVDDLIQACRSMDFSTSGS